MAWTAPSRDQRSQRPRPAYRTELRISFWMGLFSMAFIQKVQQWINSDRVFCRMITGLL